MAKKTTVFYSWQSDTPSDLNRGFIQKALENAIQILTTDANVEPALRELDVSLDKDTQGVPGSPPIADTILNKIRECSAFVADLTFVGQTISRYHPNPNVLIEYGYALGRHGHGWLVEVMNTAFGDPNETTLPFDLKYQRSPITYFLKEASEPQRTECLKQLSGALADALGPILTDTKPGRQFEVHYRTQLVAPQFENASARKVVWQSWLFNTGTTSANDLAIKFSIGDALASSYDFQTWDSDGGVLACKRPLHHGQRIPLLTLETGIFPFDEKDQRLAYEGAGIHVDLNLYSGETEPLFTRIFVMPDKLIRIGAGHGRVVFREIAHANPLP